MELREQGEVTLPVQPHLLERPLEARALLLRLCKLAEAEPLVLQRNDRVQRVVYGVRVSRALEPGVRAFRDTFAELANEARLPDSGLAREKNDLSAPCFRAAPPLQDEVELLGATDEPRIG